MLGNDDISRDGIPIVLQVIFILSRTEDLPSESVFEGQTAGDFIAVLREKPPLRGPLFSVQKGIEPGAGKWQSQQKVSVSAPAEAAVERVVTKCIGFDPAIEVIELPVISPELRDMSPLGPGSRVGYDYGSIGPISQ